MDYQFSQPGLGLDKPTTVALLVGLVLALAAWFFFERNACQVALFIYRTGRLLTGKPDLVCRMFGMTY